MGVGYKFLRLSPWRALASAVAIGLLGGCGVRVPANPTTYPLHGTVKLDGKPVTEGTVHFDPVEAGKGIPVDGKIESDGSYKTRAFVGQQGTTPGDYKVWIGPDPYGPSGGKSLQVPEKYQSAESSGLSYTVEAKDNTYDIDLK